MTDLATINAAVGSIKTAIEVVQFIRDSGTSLEKADLNLKMAEIMNALAETKIELSNIQIKLIDKDQEILELQNKLKNKEQTAGFLQARYLVNENGEPTGKPYCPTCYATSHELIPLTAWSNKEATNKCGKCGNTIESRLSPLDADYYIERNREAGENIGKPFILKVTE